ncbi:MAG: hypothetical protein JST18_07015 [Bacteroidetes bacterium]|nr:hypothetical protein [Bacteroidota bacterium]
MKPTFILTHESWELVLYLFASMIACILLGIFIGRKFYKEYEKEGTVQGALFAILGLLLAFTFSMSLSRYDKRIDIIIEEANDIGTAVLRADLYPQAEREQFRNDFRKYVEARIAYLEAGTDTSKIRQSLKDAAVVSQLLWERATRLSKDSGTTSVASMQMIPALNNMFDIANTRWYMNWAKVPEPVLYLLYLLICICSFYSGYVLSSKKKIDWISVLGFCLLVCAIVHLIIDLDRPRRGAITLEEVNESIVELRKMF